MSSDKPSTMGFAAARRLYGALVQEEARAANLPHLEGYVLSRLLGRGGGGVVYLGHRAGSDRRLTIKVLEKPLDGSPGAKRAWRELDMLTQLRLSCTPRVHDYGVHEGKMYIATEHVVGLTLVEHCRANNLTLRQRVELLARVAEAVATIHERGVIHRDLKPDNVLIDSGGQPVIIDLGIAFLLGADVTEPLTADGVSIGTPAFMSPEQARGERAAISTRSDVYSLGATACRILTGETPHDLGNSSLLEAIQKVGHERPRYPRALDPTLPKPLAAVLARALSPTPEDRYASAADLGGDLRRWLRGEPIGWTRPPVRSRLRYWVRRNPRLAIACSVALVALIAAIFMGAMAADLADYRAQAKRLMKREMALQQLRDKQINRVEFAKKEGEFFPATIVLLNIAEDIEARDLDDREALQLFTTLLNELCEAAMNEARDPAEME